MTLLFTIVVSFVLPGALIYRAPVAVRDRRAALAAEERVFWYVALSTGWSLSIVLALSALGVYTLERLLIVNSVFSLAMLGVWRGRLRFGPAASRPTWTCLLPIALVALGLWRFFPPSEYVIGGRDPGTYMNEGFQIARRGSLSIEDATVSAVPASFRDLFFTAGGNPFYYDNRFMGFFLRDPETGRTVGQFPHLYPASIAVADRLAGVRGALGVTGIWAIFGLVAVYMTAARLVGPLPATAAGALVGLNVLQVWYARYPNAEIAMQPLVFAGLLAFARAHQDDDGFFAPVAGALIALLAFVRIEAIVVVAGLGAAAVVMWLVEGRPLKRMFLVPLVAGGALALWYFTGPLAAYLDQPVRFLQKVSVAWIAAALAAAAAGMVVLSRMRQRAGGAARAAVPYAIVATIVALTIYAWFVREPGGKLTDYDAYALRTFTRAYFLWPGLVAAVLGFALIVRRDFWRDPALLLVVAIFAVFFCYKVRIVAEHFWMGRRLLPVVLPGVLLCASATVGRWSGVRPMVQAVARVIGAAIVVWLGWQYAAIAAPVAAHVEYKGLLPYLDSLAARFTDRDLVIVESRDAGSDTHVLAVPLAYLYDKHVLVLESPIPNKQVLEGFLGYASREYARVFFVGGGGTNLLSRRISAVPVADERVQLPEYEVTPWSGFPSRVRRKDFDYSVYQLTASTPPATPFQLDIGFEDDLNVVRFHAKERSEGRTIRWTGAQSFIAVPGLTGSERTISFVAQDGGRPSTAPPATLEVLFDGERLGAVTVGKGFQTYSFPLPESLVRAAAARDDPAQVVLRSNVWVPRDFLGGSDSRPLGVMMDRVEIR